MSHGSREALLACGLLSSILYLLMNALIPLGWGGYSSFSQTISELSAVDAPTRWVWFPLGLTYTVLVIAFGIGVWTSASQNRPLRLVGMLLVSNGVLGLGWVPMHQRDVLAGGGGTLTDTMHLVWAVITSSLMLLEIAFGATAFGIRFRWYSITTFIVLIVFGVLTFRAAPSVAANLPTPWLGVWERVNVLGYMLWMAVLSINLLWFGGARGQPMARRAA
jgi:hypothetical protein